jgi:Fe-S-cluster-containing hydrogenase component 2
LEEIGIDMAVTCLSCIEHPCVEECTSEALSIDPKGVIRLDSSVCSLCDLCMNACPIGAISINETEPLFCDLCEGETTCVKNCPTGALSYREINSTSLKQYLKTEGKPSQKRAHFAKEISKALREIWMSGGRVDS